MVKVTRIPLICATTDKDGNEIKHEVINDHLWKLQNETRDSKNKAIRLLWEWTGFGSDYKKKFGDYPSAKEAEKILGYKSGITGYLYNRLKGTSLNSGNFTATLNCANDQFWEGLEEMLSGKRSIIEYKSNQPLEIHKKSMSFERVKGGKYFVTISIFSLRAAKDLGVPARLRFELQVKDKSTRDILNRCIDGIYRICASRLVYAKMGKEKKMWCLNLSYGFDAETVKELDADKILGVDLGIVKPYMASVFGDKARISADGEEIEAFRKRTEERRKVLRKQGKYCGDGRIGHGYKTRNRPANDLSDKTARFRDTWNNKCSRDIVNYAVRNRCGIIQMEDLSGITAGERPQFLKNWPYYDLQSKVKYKAEEKGIKVRLVNPSYTSQRCSKCGFIYEENRPEQARFKCQSCGYEEDADYNASQNIATKDIEEIIAEATKDFKKEKTDASM